LNSVNNPRSVSTSIGAGADEPASRRKSGTRRGHPLVAETDKAEIRENAIGRVLNARPTGPGPWRARMA